MKQSKLKHEDVEKRLYQVLSTKRKQCGRGRVRRTTGLILGLAVCGFGL